MVNQAEGVPEVDTTDTRDTHRGGAAGTGVLLVGLVAGLASAVAGPTPVDGALLSAIIVTVVVAAVCSIGSKAPRPVLAWAVLIAGIATVWLPGILIATGIFVIVYLGERSIPLLADSSPHSTIVSSVLAGSAMVLASHSDLDGFLGASTIVGAIVGLVIVVAGLARSNRRVRLVAVSATLVALIAAVVASAAFAGVFFSVTDEFSDAERLVRDGLRQLGAADIQSAEASFRQASSQFETADNRLGSPIGAVAAAVPVVAQHRTAATALSSEAANVTGEVADLLSGLGPDALSMVDARIDLAAIDDFGAALDDIQRALDTLEDDIERVSSPWLLEPAATQLAEIRVEIDEQRARSERVEEVTVLLPEMLGAGGERVYLLLFTTPAEARGLGGFTGNWAEITATDGRITVSDFGRADELDDAAPLGTRTVSGPPEWLANYGVYGFTNHLGGTVGADPFKNITMSPFMSSTGQVVAELYPQSGGRELDGVFAADVYVLAELLRFSGPVDVEGADRRVNASNAAEYLLNRQYAIPDKDDRIDLIAETSDVVVDRLLRGDANVTPARLLRFLGPMAEQGRLAGWAVRSAEQTLLTDVGLAGTMQALRTDDAVTMAFNNAAGNKIDYFLKSAGRYEATIDAAGTVEGVIEVMLENDAPSRGEPRYVINNAIDAPLGTNQTLLSVYTAFPTSQPTVDGEAVVAGSNVEGGYFVTTVLVLVPPGETRTVELRVAGRFDVEDGYSLLVRSPPTVGSTPIEVELAVVDGEGERAVSETLETAGTRRVDITLGSAGAS